MRPLTIAITSAAIVATLAGVFILQPSFIGFGSGTASVPLFQGVAHEFHYAASAKTFSAFVNDDKVSKALSRHHKLLSRAEISIQDGSYADSVTGVPPRDKLALFTLSLMTTSGDIIEVPARRTKGSNLTADIVRMVDRGVATYRRTLGAKIPNGKRTITLS